MEVLPYKIATLLYAFDREDRVLLMQRAKEPNQGLWSPSGGKLETSIGESPHDCAIREAEEELGIAIESRDLHLTGLVSEQGYLGQAHWLMFLFEIKPRLTAIPSPHPEGKFSFFTRSEIANLPIPETDRETIWPLFWQHRGGFFSAHCSTAEGVSNRWTLEESRVHSSVHD